MRVHVTIPGSVDSYCIDERGDKRVATDELWLETYLCSVLRAYSYADDGSGETIRKIVGVRRFNPVTTTETEHRFLSAAEQLFFRGRTIHPLYMVPSTDAYRLATRLGLDRAGSQQCLKSSHIRASEVLLHYWKVCVWHQFI